MMNLEEKRKKLREAIAALTKPINGQYPRPWMVHGDPAAAEVFIVGKNPGFTVLEQDAKNHREFLDAMFNCDAPGRCYELIKNSHDRRTRKARTRPNLDCLRAHLSHEGVTKVMETNVICYATKMRDDLRWEEHKGGTERGTEIFDAVLNIIRPRVMVVYGVDAAKWLGKAMSGRGRKVNLPRPVYKPEFALRRESVDPGWGRTVDILVIPSLALPEWNKWCSQAETAFPVIARTVAEILRGDRTVSL